MTDLKHVPLPRRAASVAPALLAILLAATAAPAWAATVTDIYNFGVTDSQTSPAGALALARNGLFYGENVNGSSTSSIFSMSAGGKKTVEWQAGVYPNGDVCNTGLTLGADGLLYGTCSLWNNNIAAGGAIFQYNPAERQNGLRVLHIYRHVDAQGTSSQPSHLVLGTDGNLYGTAFSGYTGDPNENGSVFRITPKGVYTTLHTFQGGSAGDGSNPSGLTLAADGNFYGTTAYGGTEGSGSAGTVFRMTPAGVVTILTTFTNSGNGQNPHGGVVQGNDGNFYGSTYLGGASNQGTLFRMTPAGKVSYLHDFDGATDNGGYPSSPLTQGSDGKIYGAVADCGPSGCGAAESLFRFTPNGRYTDLYNFPPQCVNCEPIPSSPLFQAPNGAFYGVTQFGGSAHNQLVNGGTFYRLRVADGTPIVDLQTPIGRVGAKIGIFGSGLSAATAVAFNGAPAAFTIMSNTYLTATVPAGATPGFVSVTLPSTTLKSGTVFTPR